MTPQLPGRNHNYTTDVHFYTLKNDVGLFLCHPQSIIDDSPYIRHSYVLTEYWACAWVVYSVDELRSLYKALGKAIKQNTSVPSNPCTGIMVSGSKGITCDKIVMLSKSDIQTIKNKPAQKYLRRPYKTTTQATNDNTSMRLL